VAGRGDSIVRVDLFTVEEATGYFNDIGLVPQVKLEADWRPPARFGGYECAGSRQRAPVRLRSGVHRAELGGGPPARVGSDGWRDSPAMVG
jgi:hypothetical protein